MSTASDFQIVPLNLEELAYYDSLRERGIHWALLCSGARDCRGRLLYAASYTYESSTRTGRRTMATRHFCLEHAQAWAARRGIELPPLPPNVALKPTQGAQTGTEANGKTGQGGEDAGD